MLYKTSKDYLGQKKTIQLTYDKAMQISVHAVYEAVDGEEPKPSELIQKFVLDDIREIANNTMALKEGSSKPKVSLNFELTRSHLLKLNKASVEITETYKEEVKPKKKKKDKKKKEAEKKAEEDKEAEKKDEAESGEKSEEKTEEKVEGDEKDTPKDEAEGEAKKEEEKKEEEEKEPEKVYKDVKKPHSYVCNVEEQNIGVRTLSTKQMVAAKKRIRALEKRDEDKLKNDVAKNNYESTIFEFRGWLHDDENSVYITEADKEDNLEKLTTAEDWLFDNDDAGYKEFQTRTYELATAFNSFKGRKTAF